MSVVSKVLTAATVVVGGAAALLSASGRLTVDIGWRRRTIQLGPLTITVDAPRETVFDVISEPYAVRTTRAMQEKVKVVERSEAMVLAEHYTPIRPWLTTVTLETVTFERPSRVSFRLVRGPVPYVAERFDLVEDEGRTTLDYRGELGTDLGAALAWWGTLVARQWERTVDQSLASVKAEAERRAGRLAGAPSTG